MNGSAVPKSRHHLNTRQSITKNGTRHCVLHRELHGVSQGLGQVCCGNPQLLLSTNIQQPYAKPTKTCDRIPKIQAMLQTTRPLGKRKARTTKLNNPPTVWRTCNQHPLWEWSQFTYFLVLGEQNGGLLVQVIGGPRPSSSGTATPAPGT